MADLDKIIQDRASHYGDPERCHRAIGRAFRGLLEQHWGQDLPEIPAYIVALMMASLKSIRAATPQYHEDDYDDGHNYLRFAQRFHGATGTPVLAPGPPRGQRPQSYDEAQGRPQGTPSRHIPMLLLAEMNGVRNRGLPVDNPERVHTILAEEVGEVAQEVLRIKREGNWAIIQERMHEELMQVAAVALVWAESLDVQANAPDGPGEDLAESHALVEADTE